MRPHLLRTCRGLGPPPRVTSCPLAAIRKESAQTTVVAAGWNIRNSWLYHTSTGASAAKRPVNRPVARPLICVARRRMPQTIRIPISTPKMRRGGVAFGQSEPVEQPLPGMERQIVAGGGACRDSVAKLRARCRRRRLWPRRAKPLRRTRSYDTPAARSAAAQPGEGQPVRVRRRSRCAAGSSSGRRSAYRTRCGRANDCGRVSSERLWEEKFRLLTVASGLGCWTRLVEGVCSKLTLRYMSAIGWEAGSTRRVLAERIERNVHRADNDDAPQKRQWRGASPR